MVKSTQKLTRGQAKKLAFSLAKKLKVRQENIFESKRKNMKSNREYYFNITGFSPNGDYFCIGIYSFGNKQNTIDYSHNTDGRRYLNALLKAELLKFKK